MSPEVWDVAKLVIAALLGYGFAEWSNRCVVKVELTREKKSPNGLWFIIGDGGMVPGPPQMMLVVTVKNSGRSKVKLRDFVLFADGQELELEESEILNDSKDIVFDEALEPRHSKRIYVKPGRLAECLKREGKTKPVKLVVRVRDDLDRSYKTEMQFTPDLYEVSPETVPYRS
ncbi:MAG: hypothetical protein KIS61_23145 [Candidatus Eremiobacteraeota bacterium]|nr:hypothetical protein [Candidatus Eremiobacteraeota bacterium]